MISMVDVDNILYDFSLPCYKEMCLINPNTPIPDKWDNWDIFDKYVEKESMIIGFNHVHMRQREFKPFSYARELLQYLHDRGPVVIASNRCIASYDALEDWLRFNFLPHDLIHVSYDKTELFDIMKIGLVVDDNPFTLQKAMDLGIKGVGLEYPWNKGMGFTLFENLQDMLSYLKEER